MLKDISQTSLSVLPLPSLHPAAAQKQFPLITTFPCALALTCILAATGGQSAAGLGLSRLSTRLASCSLTSNICKTLGHSTTSRIQLYLYFHSCICLILVITKPYTYTCSLLKFTHSSENRKHSVILFLLLFLKSHTDFHLALVTDSMFSFAYDYG